MRAVAATLIWFSLAVPMPARAQPDAQTRRPSLARGDLLLVRGTGVLPAWETAIGLDAEVLRRPIVVFDRVLGGERFAVDTRLTTTVLYALGVGARSQVTLAVPLVWQEGEGRRVLSRDGRDELPAGAAGDVRLDFLHALAPAPGPNGCVECNVGVAFASGIVVPTGDESAFAGGPGFAAYLEGIGAGVLGPVIVQGTFGARVMEEAQLSDVAVGSELAFALGASLPLLDARLVLGAEAQALVGLRSGSSSPIVWLVEARGVLGADRRAEIALGAGTGISEALRSPAFQAILALRYVPGESRATQRAP